MVTRQIVEYEARILRLARILCAGQLEMGLLQRSFPRRAGISRDAAWLIRDTIGKSVVRWLVNSGGWRQQSFFKVGGSGAGKVTTGCVWQRHDPRQLSLKFTLLSLELLVWLASAGLQGTSDQQSWIHKLNGNRYLRDLKPSLGDEVLFALIGTAMVKGDLAKIYFRQRIIYSSPLVAWMFPEQLAASDINLEREYSFQRWFDGPAVAVLECLLAPTVEHWVQFELSQRSHFGTHAARRLGAFHRRLLDTFLDQSQQHQRTDLWQYVSLYLRRLMQEGFTSSHWRGSLETIGMRLAERSELYEQVTAPLGISQRLAEWNRQQQPVGFLDEGYEASQFWKKNWELHRMSEVIQWATEVVPAF